MELIENIFVNKEDSSIAAAEGAVHCIVVGMTVESSAVMEHRRSARTSYRRLLCRQVGGPGLLECASDRL